MLSSLPESAADLLEPRRRGSGSGVLPGSPTPTSSDTHHTHSRTRTIQQEELHTRSRSVSTDQLPSTASEAGKYSTSDNVKLWYRKYFPQRTPLGTIIIVHEFGEHVRYYDEVALMFKNESFLVMSYDQRGYGQSEGTRGHAESVERLLQDLHEIHMTFALKGKPVFLFGHGSGACLCIHYGIHLSGMAQQQKTSTASVLQNQKKTRRMSLFSLSPKKSFSSKNDYLTLTPVTGMILTAPYVKLAASLPEWQKTVIGAIAKTSSSYSIETVTLAEELTRDKIWQKIIKEDKLRKNMVSAKQLVSWEKAGERCLKDAKLFVSPVLVLHGNSDSVTSIKSAAEFFNGCGSTDRQFVQLKNYLHDLHLEVDRESNVFKPIMSWIKSKHVSWDLTPATTPMEIARPVGSGVGQVAGSPVSLGSSPAMIIGHGDDDVIVLPPKAMQPPVAASEAPADPEPIVIDIEHDDYIDPYTLHEFASDWYRRNPAPQQPKK